MKTKFLLVAVILGMSLSFTSCFPPHRAEPNHHENKNHNNHGDEHDNHDDGGRH